MKKLATLLVLFIVLLGNTISAQTENSNSLTELLKNPTYKANWDRAEVLFNSNARVIVPKIANQNKGKQLSEAEKTAYKMAEYSYFKEFPGNLSTEDKANFLYLLTLNNKYNYGHKDCASDHDINLFYMQSMSPFENQMKNNPNLKNTPMPMLEEDVKVSAEDL